MPKNTTSKEGLALFETMQTNIKARLKALGVSAYRASHYSGHNGTWISDCFRRSSGVTLAWLADVSGVLNVPPSDLLMPQKMFQPDVYSPPAWMKNLPSI